MISKCVYTDACLLCNGVGTSDLPDVPDVTDVTDVEHETVRDIPCFL